MRKLKPQKNQIPAKLVRTKISKNKAGSRIHRFHTSVVHYILFVLEFLKYGKQIKDDGDRDAFAHGTNNKIGDI